MFGRNQENSLNSREFEEMMLRSRMSIVAAPHKSILCEVCGGELQVSEDSYTCMNCAASIEHHIESAGSEGATNSCIAVHRGGYTSCYNVNNNYSLIQFKTIKAELNKRNIEYAGDSKFNPTVLLHAAIYYNNIQKFVVESDGTTEHSFVRRGANRDGILGAIIYYTGIDLGYPRKRSDIARLMNLPHGISRGVEYICGLAREGKISLPIRDPTIPTLADRYLEALSITDPMHREFVIELVMLSEKLKIGMNSLLPTKVAGAVWLLTRGYNPPPTSAKFDAAVDRTKPATFQHFIAKVYANDELLALFAKYKIEHG